MSFFRRLKERLFKSSSKIDEGLDAIMESGEEEAVETPPPASPPASQPGAPSPATPAAAAPALAPPASAPPEPDARPRPQETGEPEPASAPPAGAERTAPPVEPEAAPAAPQAPDQEPAQEPSQEPSWGSPREAPQAESPQSEAPPPAAPEQAAPASPPPRDATAATAQDAVQDVAQEVAQDAIQDSAQNAAPERRGLAARLLSAVSPLVSAPPIPLVEKKRVLDDELLEELEELLISTDLGVETAMRVSANIAEGRFGRKVGAREIKRLLAAEVARVLEPVAKPLPLFPKKPQVILVVGVNGSGKTTTIGKIASQLKGAGKSVMIAAGDTFPRGGGGAVAGVGRSGRGAGVQAAARLGPGLAGVSTRWERRRRRAPMCC